MISSTYFDLKEVRNELADFIDEELGYKSLLSEQDSFPIDPDIKTIENCKRRVQYDADILVLIIGGRYGFEDKDSNKSVTNLEYETARAKGIPIYALIDKATLTAMEIWKKNPSADFAPQIENPKIFEFIQQVRSNDSVWTREFEYARDIVKYLRIQFAYLFSKSLGLYLRSKDAEIAGIISDLNGKALSLALERPRLWQFRLMGQLLVDEVQKRSDARRAHDLGIAWGIPTSAPTASAHFAEWVNQQLEDMTRDLDNVGKLFGGEVARFEDSNSYADLNRNMFFARQIGQYYQVVLEWSARLRRCRVRSERQPILDELSTCIDDILLQLESLGPACVQEADEALTRASGGLSTEIKIDIQIRMNNPERLRGAIADWKRNGEK